MQPLSKRLSALAALVNEGERIADIGTDHGYLPVYLYKKGLIKSAVASDINEKPLSSCKAKVEQEALCDVIKTVLSDGLDQISPSDYDTIIIAGMGGEMIADILSREPKIVEKHIILNPMTHPEIARKFLYDNGFEIDRDIIVKDGRHYYSVFDAHYTGEVKEREEADYFLGNIQDFTNKEYLEHLINYLKNKMKSGKDYSKVITELEEKL